mmetsp:Transcript_11008/g.40360  ORF Transcript_11008/g.40360 Transcript_11008/m.40360 type:complete len:132 (-) Transcript_11008:53-448(-)
MASQNSDGCISGVPGTASLAEELDKKLLVQLRDGRKLIGILRSFDQFSNLVLDECIERHIVDTQFADEPLGLYIVRGENLVLLGQVDESRDIRQHLTEVPLSEVKTAQKAEKDAKELQRTMVNRFDFLDEM